VAFAAIALPSAVADTQQPPVQSDTHADYEADAGAILAQALAYDPTFRLDFTYASASLYELYIPTPSQSGTQGLSNPAAAVLSVQHVKAGRLTVDPRSAPSVLLFTEPQGLGVDSLPVHSPNQPARFAADLVAPLSDPAAHIDARDLQLNDALHYTIQGLVLDHPLRAHAQGDLLALVAQGAASAADGENTYAYDLVSSPAGQRVLLIQAQGATVEAVGEGLASVLQVPEASLAAGGQLVADVQGTQVGAGRDADVSSGSEGLSLATAGSLAQNAVIPSGARSSSADGAKGQSQAIGALGGAGDSASVAVGGAAVLAAVGIAAALASGKYAFFSILAPLYARLQNEEILTNKTREAMYRFIAEHPGVNVSEVVKQFTLGWGATVYHLRVLERNHLIVASKQGRQVCYFQNGGRYSGKMAGISAVRNANAALVARTVLEHPGAPQRDLCKITGLAQPTVSWHLQRLEEAGLVQGDAAARRRYVALPALGELAQRGLLPGMAPAMPAAPQAPAQPAGAGAA
jgi:predicted transcriptional regulator